MYIAPRREVPLRATGATPSMIPASLGFGEGAPRTRVETGWTLHLRQLPPSWVPTSGHVTAAVVSFLALRTLPFQRRAGNRRTSGERSGVAACAIHGLQLRLPAGSTVYLTGVSQELEGEPCEVVSFDRSGRWLVRFLHPRFRGRTALVPEQCLQFGYSVRPEHARSNPSTSSAVLVETARSGRGLQASRAFTAGSVVFKELPFLLTANDVNEVCRAYFNMRASGRKESTQGVEVEAFESLSAGDGFSAQARARVQAQAAEVWQAMTYGRAQEPEASELQNLTGALLRWEANRFLQQVSPNAEPNIYAVYSLVSRLNHSCAPTVRLRQVFRPLQPGFQVPDDGTCLVQADRDLEPGDALVVNYGLPELLEWPVEQRREYLLQRNGFCCQCPRCLSEAGEDVSQRGKEYLPMSARCAL
ncbi:unnamed protein product [Symbiodinium natans]|uniref:SET domain-containing protein n=1 Tax=Symbiodinium natans TaxID=878477 RepID=A0A812HKN6_9DINO|nr:unnamed protein product [Symbiodinium natans]